MIAPGHRRPGPARARPTRSATASARSLATSRRCSCAVVLAAVAGVRAAGRRARPARSSSRASSTSTSLKGVKRIFGMQALWQGAKARAEDRGDRRWCCGRVVQGLCPCCWARGTHSLRQILGAAGGGRSPGAGRRSLAGLRARRVRRVVVMRRNRKQTRMTKKEIKDEHKQSEGDPLIKGQIRSAAARDEPQPDDRRGRRRRRRAGQPDARRRRAALRARHAAPRAWSPRAPVTSPPGSARSPPTKRVPMVQDIPLARALHAACELGQEIPAAPVRRGRPRPRLRHGAAPPRAAAGIAPRPGRPGDGRGARHDHRHDAPPATPASTVTATPPNGGPAMKGTNLSPARRAASASSASSCCSSCRCPRRCSTSSSCSNIPLALVVLLTSMYVKKPLDFSVFPSLLLVAHPVPARPQRRLDPAGAARRLRRPGHRRVRAHRGRRLARHRPGDLPDPRGHPVRRHHQRRRARRRGRRAVHPRRDARQADGDRRRPQRRPDRRGHRAASARAEVAAEADFYGAMDGGSKFVKGDAIAGIIITIINLLGGFAIGMLQMGMSPGEALAALHACSPSATAWSPRSRRC